MAIGAVITGDIVGSTTLDKATFKKLSKSFDTLLSGHQYEFFRGDSFQVYVKSPVDALPTVLQMRTTAMKISSDEIVCDVKACIGVGQVKAVIKTLHSSTDEAFVLSGRNFDKIKPPQRLLIVCSDNNPVVQTGLQVTGDYIDYIFRHLTIKQAAVLFELQQNRTQTEVAKRLKKSQATVHKHAQAAGWPEMEKLLENYKQLISAIKN
jgi:hypothetical protein